VRKKAAYYLFSLLIVLSSTFGVAPMAFCTVKTHAPQHSCCKPPVTTKNQCPICAFELNKIQPSPAYISVKSHNALAHVVTLLPCILTALPPQDFAMTDYVIAYNDTSPPLYLQNSILRI
jgi:hypothetical protein